jgi:hypothetical protein
VGQRLGKALVDPAAGFQATTDGRVTNGEVVVTHVVANHVDGPAGFQVAIVARTVGPEGLQLVFQGGTLERRASGRRGVVESLDTLRWRGAEPFAKGMFVTLSTLGDLWHTQARSVAQDIVAALHNL